MQKHPLAIRWFHWVNFPTILVMVWSGVLILWANDVYPTQLYQLGHRLFHSGRESAKPPVWLKVPDRVILLPELRVMYSGDALPPGFPPEEKRLEIVTGFRLADGMRWHFALAWLFALNGFAYAAFLALSGQWKHLAPRKESLKEAVKVAVKDLAFWRRPELAPEGEKYNHAQRIAYTGVGFLGLGMLVTGLAISKPAQLSWLVGLLGGYQTARLEHFGITALLVLFFFVHVAQVLRAGWRNLRGMLVGN